MKRIIADIILISCLFAAPWYVTAVLIFIFIILFPNYWEAVVAGLVIDSLYSLPGQNFPVSFGLFSGSALILVYISSLLKEKISIPGR